MEGITLGQIATALAIITGIVGGIAGLYKYFQSLVKKEIETEMNPVMNKLNEIANKVDENNSNYQELKDEVILMVKLQQATITDLKEKNHLNGETTEALNKLNEFLLQR